MIKRLWPIIAILILLPTAIFADNLRGETAAVVVIPEEGYSQTAVFKPEQLIAISTLPNNSFLEAIEVKIDIPRNLQNYRNTFACYFYKNITPEPSTSLMSYNGHQFYMHFMPSQNSISFIIPVEQTTRFTNNASQALISAIINDSNYPILLTVLPIMKGVPDSAMSEEMQVSCRAIYKEQGTLSLNIYSNNSSVLQNDQISVYIDNLPVTWPQSNYTLTSGFHTVSVYSELLGIKEYNVTINSAQNAVLNHSMNYSDPSIVIDGIPGAEFYLDDELIENEQIGRRISLSAGTHIIMMKLGEWLVEREFTIQMSEIYNISLFAEILLEKE